ncbi:MAG: winged helix-turn-helix transcriptional regulator [Methanocorpusculum parvum]|nr:winged helix-turn-helix transcriptional regulator [Methanocorpusculum parvum]
MPALRSSPNRNTKPQSPLPEKITACLQANPGAQLCKIVETVGGSRGAVTYHIRTLAEKGIVTVHKEGGYNRYYLHTFAYEKDKAALAANLENPIKADIIKILLETPRLSRKELAEKTGIKENTLFRHIASMGKSGILKRERDGHCWRYRLAEKIVREHRNE